MRRERWWVKREELGGEGQSRTVSPSLISVPTLPVLLRDKLYDPVSRLPLGTRSEIWGIYREMGYDPSECVRVVVEKSRPTNFVRFAFRPLTFRFIHVFLIKLR